MDVCLFIEKRTSAKLANLDIHPTNMNHSYRCNAEEQLSLPISAGIVVESVVLTMNHVQFEAFCDKPSDIFSSGNLIFSCAHVHIDWNNLIEFGFIWFVSYGLLCRWNYDFRYSSHCCRLCFGCFGRHSFDCLLDRQTTRSSTRLPERLKMITKYLFFMLAQMSNLCGYSIWICLCGNLIIPRCLNVKCSSL